MKFKLGLLFSLSMFMSACASVDHTPADIAETFPLLSIEAKTKSNQPADIQKNDFIIKLEVAPIKLARATESANINITEHGQFKVSENDTFFATKSAILGTIYCGYTNIHSNFSKTTLNQGCLGDQDKDGSFDTYLMRTGARHHDIGGFLYHDAEVARIAVTGEQTQVSYVAEKTSKEQVYLIAFRFKKIAKRKGEKYAVIDIVTKKPGTEQWTVFFNRDPIEIKFPAGVNKAIFTTPMFTAELSNPTYKSLTAMITSVAPESTFGFKRSLKNEANIKYTAAYRTTGYGQ